MEPLNSFGDDDRAALPNRNSVEVFYDEVKNLV